MWPKIAAAVLGVLIDKLILPFITQAAKKWKRAADMKKKIETNRQRGKDYADATTIDQAEDAVNKLP